MGMPYGGVRTSQRVGRRRRRGWMCAWPLTVIERDIESTVLVVVRFTVLDVKWDAL